MSVFAWAFGRLRDREKPRLRRSAGGLGWVCESSNGRRGFGVNPQMAYGAWRAMRDEPTRFGTNPFPPRGHVPPRLLPPPRRP